MPSDSVTISWDENVPSRDDDPDRWDELRGHREGVLFFMWVACRRYRYQKITWGLVLRMLPDPRKENSFVRVGVFTDNSQNIGEVLSMKIKYPATNETINMNDTEDGEGEEDKDGLLPESGMDLDDPRLAIMVHTVTIV
ncbi:hypothetical protein GGR53DRAFT_473974 [Hypoxylon sp. FL1150]|nr:hypothetical protein GGR53DRAFT_473974 [Hypoxylon sp. FL1150]